MNVMISLCWAIFWMHVTGTPAFPTFPSSITPNNHSLFAYSRDVLPQVPERPASSGLNSFHGNQFKYLEQTGFGPAVDAMPVFLYSRTTSLFVSNVELGSFLSDLNIVQQPCYPESAIQHHDEDGPSNAPEEPNKGTHVPIGANPGKSCTDPGPYHGAYSEGNSFPVYVIARYCNKTDDWRVTYNVYYV